MQRAQVTSLASSVTVAFSSRFMSASAALNALVTTIKASSESPKQIMSNWTFLKEHLAVVGLDLYDIYSSIITLIQIVPHLIDDLVLPPGPFDATIQGINYLSTAGNGTRTPLPLRTNAALSNYPYNTVVGPLASFYPGW
jgi:hypothetical protein